MKTNKRNELLRILAESDRCISSAILANLLGVSERTIRNYIKEINSDGQAEILSSRDGYHLKSASYKKKDSRSETEARVYQILSELLTNKEGFSVFDEAEALHVSSSTIINTIIPRIKTMIKDYDLHIESQKYQFILKGKEQDKRKLIGHIATNNSYGFFSSADALNYLFPEMFIPEVMQKLYILCNESGLFLNDYALNNLLLHILVILIRLESDNHLDVCEQFVSIENLLDEFPEKERMIAFADLIASTFDRDYHVQIPESDYQQILILIALSVENEMVDIHDVIGQDFIDDIEQLLSILSNRYCIQDFNTEFVLQFALHMHYARQRYNFQVSYPNPIGAQFKKDYAPIFDMAVYFAHKFSNIYHIEFSEDEIAFIAFHLGAYLSNCQNSEMKICGIIVVESYHLLSKNILREIEQHFSDKLTIVDILPLNSFLRRAPVCDLIISTFPLNATCRHIVQVNPVLTKQNINSIRNAIDEIYSEKELNHIRCFLRSLLHKELYFRNVTLNSVSEYIRFMGNHCILHRYVNEEFVQDVLLRESFSCTAFTDVLAVPHSISQYADKSFICVIHNDVPINWNRKEVRFVFMIGIAEQDMKHFKGAFDLIIELFNSTSRTLDLLNTSNFEEFCSELK